MLKRLLVVGGDARAERMAPLLAKDGYEVETLGLHPGDEKSARVAHADALIFPYPFAVKNGCVPTLTGLTLHPGDVLEAAKNGAVIIAGKGLESDVLEANKDLRLLSFSGCVPLLERNAELSAEAAVCEAMQRTDMALLDMSVLVTGYGRFGRALAVRLHGLGAQVWVAARRDAQRLQAQSDGMRALPLEDLPQAAPGIQMVLNTIPAHVIPQEVLEALPHGAWLLELASAPYGFNRDNAVALGLRCDVLPALPARYAPMSAARAMKQTCIRLLLEAEMI